MKIKNNLTTQILIAMFAGVIFGLAIRIAPKAIPFVVDNFLSLGGTIFITLMKMLVVPVVVVSLTCGVCNLGDMKKIGRLGLKSLTLFILTTAFAIFLGLFFANLFNLGVDTHLISQTSIQNSAIPSFRQFFLNIFPSNPIKAMVDGNMLQLIIFSILFGLAINSSGKPGKNIAKIMQDLNHVIMYFINMLMKAAPIGVFCLIAKLFAQMGADLILSIAGYFFTVLFVLLIHMIFTYFALLRIFANLSPWTFFRKMYPTMLFAFSVSSSNASIPLMLETTENSLGVSNSIASFVIPLGVNINKNGTAIMQGVATIFIAHAYQINLGMIDCIMIILTATLASIATAGVPGIGMIALVMVLKQVNVPIEGIALIIGIDRLLDMARTVVNVASNSAIACLVGKSEKQLNIDIYSK